MLVKDNILRRRLTTSYFTSIISITLVLFMLGLVGLLLLNTRKLSDYVKENIGFSIFLSNTAREVDIFSLQKTLDTKKYVKETRYISKEKAAEDFQKELGEDFVEFLGFNPLPPTIDVKLHANYANNDSIALIEKEIRAFSQVIDVTYQKDLIYAVNENVRKISLAILAFCSLLFLIALTLINNTIRLSVYSKRFIIRTMQLVGAHHSFIRLPFLIKGATQGLIAAFISITMLSITLYFAEKQFEGLFSFQDFRLLAILFASIFVLGIFLVWLSTLLSVNKYLKMKTDNLYT
jgi:cell division transport system permease protein